MAYVDECSVAHAMTVLLGGTGLLFKAVPAEDESVDAEVEVLLHGQPTDHSVQVGGGYVVLNEYRYSGQERRPEQLESSRQLGSWGVQAEDMRALATALQRRLLAPTSG